MAKKKQNSINKQNNNNKRKDIIKPVSDKLIFYLLILMLALIPLIVRGKSLQKVTPFIFHSGITTDFFNYYKLLALLSITLIILIIFVFKILKEKHEIKLDFFNVSILLLILLIITSGITAKYKIFALLGDMENLGGTLTYLSYLLILLIASNIKYDRKKIDAIFLALFPLLIVNFLFSLLSFYGVNPLDNTLISSLVIPTSLPDVKFVLYTTLANYDYLSGITGVFTVLFFIKAIYEKRFYFKIMYIVMSLMAFATVLSTYATSGFFTISLLVPLIIIFAFLITERKKAIITFGTTIILFIFIFLVLNYHNSVVYDKTIGFFVGPKVAVVSEKKLSGDKYIYTKKSVPVKSTSIKDIEDTSNTKDKQLDLPQIASTAGSGRLYIWQRTTGLILKKPILGYGLDTLYYFFPQDDPYKISGLGSGDFYIYNPHNMYLFIAFGSGVLTLSVLLIIIARYIYVNLKLFRLFKANDDWVNISTTLFVGLNAFLIQAFFNDTIIGTGVVFWIMFGVSISLLRYSIRIDNN